MSVASDIETLCTSVVDGATSFVKNVLTLLDTTADISDEDGQALVRVREALEKLLPLVKEADEKVQDRLTS